jgi:hypothetical protein
MQEPSRPDWRLQREAAAYHEAAHAVVAEAMGYRVRSITFDDDELTGEVRFAFPAWDVGTPAGRWRRLAVTLAGRLGEAVYLDRADLGDADRTIAEVVDLLDGFYPNEADEDVREEWGPDGGDALDAALLVRGLPDDDAVAELRDAHATAHEVLSESWADVCALADDLHGAAGNGSTGTEPASRLDDEDGE